MIVTLEIQQICLPNEKKVAKIMLLKGKSKKLLEHK
jgi:hypothetical protein